MKEAVSSVIMAGVLLAVMTTACAPEVKVEESEGGGSMADHKTLGAGDGDSVPESTGAPAILDVSKVNTENPTAKGRWQAVLARVLPDPKPLPLHNVHVLGPFENAGFQGFLTPYPPEQGTDLTAVYQGKAGELRWRRAPGLDGPMEQPADFSEWLPPEAWSVLYVYAEVAVEEAQIAQLATGLPVNVWAWANGELAIAPTFPHLERPLQDRAFIALRPGTNTLLLKLHLGPEGSEPWVLLFRCDSYGQPEDVEAAVADLADRSPDAVTRLLARYTLAELAAAQGNVESTHRALDALRGDPAATRWDVYWADAAAQQHTETGSFLPLHDIRVAYTPVTGVEANPAFWPQSPPPARELLVADVSASPPQEEFALSVLQGLVNREEPCLYLLHTRYNRQDREWLDELHFEGYSSREIAAPDVWSRFRHKLKGAVLYDGEIMDEIGEFHSDRLNQTNLLMMIGALEDAVPVTPEMNETLQLPVVFDARGKWASQYEMMHWAYEELFPQMNPGILATNYPGIFYLTDYLVAFKIFTFWFPEDRTTPEENLLRGILASTPPNTPLVGWWFDWMPNPKDPKQRHADAVMEPPGVLRGSFFGKVLTPSHEATNLSVHSGVPVGPYRHKPPSVPEFSPDKVYYAHIISDGDNLGEALMMRTRDLQWDKPERGGIPMGWSFAPAAARMAPPVLNYFLRTASPDDLLVGGLGVGYTEPVIYLRAFPEQREALYADYVRMTDEALKWIDTPCLWLINGGDEEEDRYAEGSSGQLQGIFTGYGGSPDTAAARIAPNNVVAFRSATSEFNGTTEEKIEVMVNEIREAVGDTRPAFIEAWVLNWAWGLDMLNEVERRLGTDFVCVRPDVLVQLRQQHEK